MFDDAGKHRVPFAVRIRVYSISPRRPKALDWRNAGH
jgi:hypothetical protein